MAPPAGLPTPAARSPDDKFLGEIIYALLRVYGFFSSNGVSDRMSPTKRIKPDPRLARAGDGVTAARDGATAARRRLDGATLLHGCAAPY